MTNLRKNILIFFLMILLSHSVTMASGKSSKISDEARNDPEPQGATVTKIFGPFRENTEVIETPIKDLPNDCFVPQNSTGLKLSALERPLRSGPQIPAIARGYEEIYLRFLNGKLIYRPDSRSDVGKIELPIAALPNPLKGEFDLSLCGNMGKTLSLNTGYRKGQNPANKDKFEIWFVPRFVIERERSTTAEHFSRIMTEDKWPNTAPIGIFYTLGISENLKKYDYVTEQTIKQLTQGDLYQKWRMSPRAISIGVLWYEKFSCWF